jgi:uncharacterized surface protein with fasciclin (FAS1) repeats
MHTWIKRFGVIATLFTALLAGCGGSDDHPTDVIAVARGDAQFSILVEAVEAAGLTNTLSAPGSFTVFAPTNDAFASLLTELGLTKAQLFADKPLLTAVLQYHVLDSKVSKAQVPLGQPIEPLAGGYFKIDSVNNALQITDGRNRVSTIVVADVAASNGVIHAIDKVLLPADKTVLQTAQALAAGSPAEFTILSAAVEAAGLSDTLNGTGPFTVFAPTDAAFADLLAQLNITADQLLANTDLLTKVLTYHVVPGLVLKAQVPLDTAITTVQGQTFQVDSSLTITDASGGRSNIVTPDVLASNGVIHVINKVLLPL